MPADTRRLTHAMTFLRVAVATLLFIHGAYRAATGGVAGFGGYLGGNHIPAGVAVAWLITTMEILGTVALALGFFVRPLALWYTAVLTAGILMVHGPEGWFVVGGGRNGMEYSVALIALLLAQAWAAPGRRGRGSGAPAV
ncbi:MAG: DoxX family protein [Gemmatimonadetes bacterium]|nr:DoxX family protein [Gemmatimonadota bacterium]